MGHAKALLSLEDTPTQLMVYEQILEYGFSVRKTEEIVKALNEDSSSSIENKPKKAKKKTPEEYQLLKNHLSDFLGIKVSFTCDDKGKGKITIPFSSEQELERIVQIFDSLKK
jgi:ParB family chromosome partitioning protein